MGLTSDGETSQENAKQVTYHCACMSQSNFHPTRQESSSSGAHAPSRLLPKDEGSRSTRVTEMTPTKHHEKGLSGRRGGALRGSPDAVISREVSEHLLSSGDLGRNKGRSAAAGGRGLRGARGGRGQPERGQAAGTGGGALAREGDALGPCWALTHPGLLAARERKPELGQHLCLFRSAGC